MTTYCKHGRAMGGPEGVCMWCIQDAQHAQALAAAEKDVVDAAVLPGFSVGHSPDCDLFDEVIGAKPCNCGAHQLRSAIDALLALRGTP